MKPLFSKGRKLAMAAAALAMACAGLGSAAAQSCPYSKTYTQKLRVNGLVAQGDKAFQQPGTLGSPTNNLAQLYNNNPGTFAEVELYVFWSAIEPSQGTFKWDAVEAALQNLCKYNLTVSSTQQVRARLTIVPASSDNNTPANQAQPSWATKLGEDAGENGLTITYPPRASDPLTVGEWWSTAYTKAWADMQTALAGQYDSNALVAETLIGTCASVDLEVWLSPSLPHDLNEMYVTNTPHYSDAAQLACLNTSPDAYAAWKNTYVVASLAGFRAQDGYDPQTMTPNPKVIPADTTNMELTYTNPSSNKYLKTFVFQQTALSPTLDTSGDNSYLVPFQTYGATQGVSFQPDVNKVTYTIACDDVRNGLKNFNQTEFELNENTSQMGGAHYIAPLDLVQLKLLLLKQASTCPTAMK